jgi:heat shock protein HslJ
MKIKSLILTLTLVAAAALGVSAQNQRITGIQWKLTYANGREVSNSAAYFEIEPGQEKFTGNTGCNQMFGPVAVKGDRITFSNIGMTKRVCKLMEGNVSENVFVSSLNKSYSYAVLGNTLHIYDKNRRTVLRFQRPVKMAPVDPEPSEAKNLEDGKWMLESVGNRRTLVAIEGAFLIFDKAKRSAGGNSGCNSFGGNYKASGSTLKMSKMIMTMMACNEGGKMEVEREFMDGLRATNRYEIRDGRLFLYKGRTLLLTLRGEPK